MQLFDVFVVFSIVLIIDNWPIVWKAIKYTCCKSKEEKQFLEDSDIPRVNKNNELVDRSQDEDSASASSEVRGIAPNGPTQRRRPLNPPEADASSSFNHESLIAKT